MLDALSSPLFYPVLFVQLTFSNETIYLWSGIGTTTFNGQTWSGIGGLLGVSATEDSSKVEAKGILVSLSAIDATLLPEALQYVQLGLPVIVYLGLSSGAPITEGGTLVSSPVVAWSGRIDQPTFTISGDTCNLSIACENRLVDMNVSIERRYTNDDTQSLNPGDLGCSFVATTNERTLYWGGFPSSTNDL